MLAKTEIEKFVSSNLRDHGYKQEDDKRSAYFVIQSDIRDSGFRVTRRVKEIIWAALER